MKCQDAIYRGPLKRHRASLRKLMLDSSDKIPRGPTSSSDSSRYRAWMPNRDVLNFITSGRMCNLRELSIAIDYKDWVSRLMSEYLVVFQLCNVLILPASFPSTPTSSSSPPFPEHSLYCRPCHYCVRPSRTSYASCRCNRSAP